MTPDFAFPPPFVGVTEADLAGQPRMRLVLGPAGMTLRDYFAAHAPPPPGYFAGPMLPASGEADEPAALGFDPTWPWVWADEVLARRADGLTAE